MLGAAQAACTPFTGIAPAPTAIPQTTQATAPVRLQRQGTTPVVLPATTKLMMEEEIEFSGVPNLPIMTTCCSRRRIDPVYGQKNAVLLSRMLSRRFCRKFKLQAISLGSNKGTKDNSFLEDEGNLSSLITAATKHHCNYNIHTPFQIVFPVQLLVSPDLRMDSRASHSQPVQAVQVGYAITGCSLKLLVQLLDRSN
jgi:hypothetical protein